MKTNVKRTSNWVVVVLVSAMAGAIGAQATVVTTTPQVFQFGPAADNFTRSASLAAFDQLGTLVGVHVELSGYVDFLLTATSAGTPGTVNHLQEQAYFSIAGLPSAPLETSSPAFVYGPFDLAAGSSQSFGATGVGPLISIDLSAILDLNAYDVSAGAPALLPFIFTSREVFAFDKSGSGLFAGSDVTGQGTVTAWYTYQIAPPPPPAIPEMNTAVSTGAFLLVGFLVAARAKMKRGPAGS